MDKEYLKDQIDYAQARIEELDKLLLNTESSTKGYKESIDAYNKWVDRHGELMSLLIHFDDIDIDKAKLDLEKEKLKVQQQIESDKQSSMKEIEQNKLDLERERQAIMQELEQDKINVETERLRLERERFAHDVQVQKRAEIEQAIYEVLELSVKIGVPVAVILAIVGVSKLAYVKEAQLELCNGRVYGGIKDLLSLARLAI